MLPGGPADSAGARAGSGPVLPRSAQHLGQVTLNGDDASSPSKRGTKLKDIIL